MNAHHHRQTRRSWLWLCLLLGLAAPFFCGAQRALGAQTDQASAFPRTHFLRLLASADPLTRQAALARIEREFAGHPQAAQTLLDLLSRAPSDKGERALALIRMLRLFPQEEVSQRLTALLESPDFRQAMVALDILAERRPSESLPAITALAQRREFRQRYGFRAAVLQAAMAYEDPGAIDFLIKQFSDLDGQAQAIVSAHLAGISGLPRDTSAEGWHGWWQGVDRSALRKTPARPAAGPVEKPPSGAFFGIQIQARRIVFVIDTSLSMLEPAIGPAGPTRAAGRTIVPRQPAADSRLVKAQHELIRTLDGLPEETSFNIVVFSRRVASWQRRLVPATAENKARARQFVAQLTPEDGTASFDALLAGMRLDDNLETLFFLSDGEPTVGQIVLPAQIVEAVAAENYFRRITLHTVGFGARPAADQFLQSLSQRGGGVHRTVGQR